MSYKLNVIGPPFDRVNSPYAQIVNVAKSGADFTTIQGAIDSITDATSTKRYCIKVNSGIYTEDITMKDYVDIVGSGRTNSIINSTSGTALTFPPNKGTIIDMGITVDYGTITANSQAIVSSGADSVMLRCDIRITKSGGNYIMKALAVSAGSFRMMECYFFYSITGITSGSALIQPAVSHTGATTIFLLHSNEITMSCDDTNDELVGFETIAGSIGSWLLENNIITINATNTATGLWLYGTAMGATVARNRITITAPTSYGLYIDSDAGGAIVDTRHNGFLISGAASYSAYVDTGDTWNSTFDKMTSVNGYTGSLGTINFVSSPKDGNFTVNDIIDIKEGSLLIPEYSTDPVSPNLQEIWVLRSGSPVVTGGGTLQGILGLSTYLVSAGSGSGAYSYQFSYRTQDGTTKRVTIS